MLNLLYVALQGQWVHPEIDNPEYSADDSIGKFDEVCALGFDLWQVKSGTIFDNVLITNDPAEAKKVGEELWKATAEAEKKMKEAQEEEERKKMEEEAKAKKEKEDDEDADDDEEEEADDKKAAAEDSADHDEL